VLKEFRTVRFQLMFNLKVLEFIQMERIGFAENVILVISLIKKLLKQLMLKIDYQRKLIKLCVPSAMLRIVKNAQLKVNVINALSLIMKRTLISSMILKMILETIH